MNEPWKWTESDLQALINTQRKESIDLDYKESKSLQNSDKRKDEISKDVSAFANSAGGVIIYGIRENGHIPIEIDEGVDVTQITKEWLEQVISSRIQRKIDGIRINQIDLTNASDKAVYVIWIPQSTRAPHQAHDKKFYKRHNFESTPMEEYEIRDVGHRNEAPLLNLVTDKLGIPTEISFDSNDAEGEYTSFDLGFALQNKSFEPANYAVVRVYVESKLKFLATKTTSKPVTVNTDNGEKFEVHVFEYIYGTTTNNQMPIFSGVTFSLFDTRIFIRKKHGASNYHIGWEIHSPKMNRQTNDYTLKIYQDDSEKWFAELVAGE